MRGESDVQDDQILADDPQIVRDALVTLWNEFCSDPTLWEEVET